MMMTSKEDEAEKRSFPPSQPNETQERALLERIDRLEATLESLMKAITSDDYREHWEKKRQRRMKARLVGTPEQARRARVGNAAKASGIDFHDWVERYGMRDTMLTRQERYELASDPRQIAMDLPEPKRKPGRPKGSKDKKPRKKYERKK